MDVNFDFLLQNNCVRLPFEKQLKIKEREADASYFFSAKNSNKAIKNVFYLRLRLHG